MLTKLLTLAGLAEAWGVPVSTLRRNIKRMQRDHGFPSSLPGLRGRYDPEAVDRWCARQNAVAPTVAVASAAIPEALQPRPAQDGSMFLNEAAETAYWQELLDRRSEEIGEESRRRAALGAERKRQRQA